MKISKLITITVTAALVFTASRPWTTKQSNASESSIKQDSVDECRKYLTAYCSALSQGNLSQFWNSNPQFLDETAKLHQQYPRDNWPTKDEQLRQAWKQQFDRSIGSVNSTRLEDFVYEPQAAPSIDIVEIRPSQDGFDAFLKISYPHAENAPTVTSNGDEFLLQSVTLKTVAVKMSSGFRFSPVEVVGGNYNIYPIPAISETEIITLFRTSLQKSFPRAYVAKAIKPGGYYAPPSVFSAYADFLRLKGFSWKQQQVGPGQRPGDVSVSFLGVVPPSAWETYLVSNRGDSFEYRVSETLLITNVLVSGEGPRRNASCTIQWQPITQISSFLEDLQREKWYLGGYTAGLFDKDALKPHQTRATLIWKPKRGWIIAD